LIKKAHKERRTAKKENVRKNQDMEISFKEENPGIRGVQR
jgi:hypothetical protein